MNRINFLIDDVMLMQLKSLSGTMTEHIRRAIYEYLQKLSIQNVSASQSKGVKDEISN